jgi:hypothetical protein
MMDMPAGTRAPAGVRSPLPAVRALGQRAPGAATLAANDDDIGSDAGGGGGGGGDGGGGGGDGGGGGGGGKRGGKRGAKACGARRRAPSTNSTDSSDSSASYGSGSEDDDGSSGEDDSSDSSAAKEKVREALAAFRAAKADKAAAKAKKVAAKAEAAAAASKLLPAEVGSLTTTSGAGGSTMTDGFDEELEPKFQRALFSFFKKLAQGEAGDGWLREAPAAKATSSGGSAVVTDFGVNVMVHFGAIGVRTGRKGALESALRAVSFVSSFPFF